MYIVWSYFQMKHTFLMTFSFLIFFPSSLLGVRSDRTASQFICIVWCYFSFCYCCCCCCCWLPQRINQILMGNKNLRPFHKLRHFLPDGLSDQSEEVWTMGKADECAIAGKSITKPLYCNNARIVSYTSLLAIFDILFGLWLTTLIWYLYRFPILLVQLLSKKLNLIGFGVLFQILDLTNETKITGTQIVFFLVCGLSCANWNVVAKWWKNKNRTKKSTMGRDSGTAQSGW